MTKPLLKWVGGKTQILNEVIGRFPQQMNNYHEPFVGGGSVLLAFLTLVKEGRIVLEGDVYASDKNLALVSLYINIQQRPYDVIKELKPIVERFLNLPDKLDVGQSINRCPQTLEEAEQCKEQYYYYNRRQYNYLLPVDKCSCLGTALFIFLNKTCFRGMYREGPHGFNVPYGNYNNPSVYDENHILKVSSLIQNVIFKCQCFETSLENIRKGDFIYFDPPYAPEGSNSFVGYTKDGFSANMHDKLFIMCERLTMFDDVKFIMSNADVEVVHNAFPKDKYNVEVVKCKRAINSKKPNSTTNEVIIRWTQ